MMSLDIMENKKKGAMIRLFTYFIVSLKLWETLPVCKKHLFFSSYLTIVRAQICVSHSLVTQFDVLGSDIQK